MVVLWVDCLGMACGWGVLGDLKRKKKGVWAPRLEMRRELTGSSGPASKVCRRREQFKQDLYSDKTPGVCNDAMTTQCKRECVWMQRKE